MIGGEPMPDKPQLAETVRIPMVAVPVELLRRAECVADSVLSLKSARCAPGVDHAIFALRVRDDIADALAAQ